MWPSLVCKLLDAVVSIEGILLGECYSSDCSWAANVTMLRIELLGRRRAQEMTGVVQVRCLPPTMDRYIESVR